MDMWDKMLDNILDGKDPAGVDCANEVTAMPSTFKVWAKDNAERIDRATTAGTLPYFLRDNQELVEKGRVIKNPLSERIKKRRKEIQRLAYATICSQALSAPGINDPITISKKSVKEWLNQPFANIEAKNEALLQLPKLYQQSQYMGYVDDIHDPEMKAYIHETIIGEITCWIITRAIYEQGLRLHSITDNPNILKMLKKK